MKHDYICPDGLDRCIVCWLEQGNNAQTFFEKKDMKKTIGELIDELSILNIKIFFLIDKIRANEHTKEDAKKTEELNMQRSKLKNAINERFGERQEIKI